MANRFEMVFKAIDKATAPIRKINKAIGGITGAAGKLAKIGVIGASLGLATLSTGLTLGVTKAIAFESAMADVKKVVDFDSPQGFKDMGKDIIGLSREIPLTAVAISEIVAAAGQSNVAREDLLGFAEGAAKVSVAFDMAAGAVGDNLAKIKKNLSLSVDETFAFADTLNHLSNNEAALASQLLVFSRNTVSLGVANGFTANEVAALGAAMIGTGAEADVAKTSFNNMVRALTKGEAATSANNEAFTRLGLNAKDVAKTMQVDAVGTFQNVLEKIRSLPKEVQKATISQLFGDEARALEPLINNVDVLKTALANVADESKFVGKSVEAEFQARADTTANAIRLMKNNLDGIGISIGSRVLPPLKDALIIINKFLAGMGDGTSALEEAMSSVQAFWGEFFAGLSSNFGNIKTGVADVASAMSSFGQEVGSIFSSITGESETFATAFGKTIGAGIETALNLTTKAFEGMERVIKAFEPAIKGIAGFIMDVFNGAREQLGPTAQVFSEMLTSVGELGGAFGKLFDAITGGNGKAVAEFVGTVLVGTFKALFEIIRDIAKMITFTIDGIAKLINKAKEGTSSFGGFFSFREKSDDAKKMLELFHGPSADKAISKTKELAKATNSVTAANDNAGVDALKKSIDAVSKSSAASRPPVDLKTIKQAAAETEAVRAAQAAIKSEAAAVLQAVNTMVQQANATLQSVDWTVHGSRMMDTLAAGMKARAHVVVDQIKATMQEVRNHLPSSPAKVGPLNDIHKLKFGETIARSIKAEPMVKAMRSAAAATRAAANDNAFGVLAKAELSRSSPPPVAKAEAQRQARRGASSNAKSGGNRSTNGGGGTTIHYSPTITIKGGGADTEERFKEMLKEHSREIKKIVDGEGSREKRRSYG